MRNLEALDSLDKSYSNQEHTQVCFSLILACDEDAQCLEQEDRVEITEDKNKSKEEMLEVHDFASSLGKVGVTSGCGLSAFKVLLNTIFKNKARLPSEHLDECCQHTTATRLLHLA